MIVTKNFTEGFPEDEDSFKSEEITKRIVTAREIYTIMERFRDYRAGKPGVTKPNIYALHIGMFNEKDAANFRRLANYCLTGRFAGADGTGSEIPSSVTEMVDHFISAGFHPMDTEDLSAIRIGNISTPREHRELLHHRLRVYLDDAAVLKNTVRYRAALAVPIEKNPFRYIDQTLRVSENGLRDKQEKHIRINKLAETLVHNPCGDQKRYGRFAILSSDGGMGKTTQLKKLCADYQQQLLQAMPKPSQDFRDIDYDDILKKPIVLYMPAKEMNKYQNVSFYSVLAKYLGFHQEPYEVHGQRVERDYTNAEEYLLNHLFNNPYDTDYAPCLLCIDGLDEIRSSDLLMSLIATLKSLLERGIAVIVSMRGSGLIDNTANGIRAKMDSLENIHKYLPENFCPHPQSRLFKLLQIPFYFTMYYETVAPDRTREATNVSAKDFDSLFHRSGETDLDKQIYYHSCPETPGELIWNYIARHIYNTSYGDTERSARNFFYLMFVLPKLAVLDRDRRAFKQNAAGTKPNAAGRLFQYDIEGILLEAWEEFNRNGWYPFWSDRNTPLYSGAQIGTVPDCRAFIDFCVNPSLRSIRSVCTQSRDLSSNRFPVLDEKIMQTERNTGIVTYEFSHAFIADAFVAIHEIGDIVSISRTMNSLIALIQKNALYGGDMGNLPDSLSVLVEKPIFADVLKRPIMKLISEICAEREGLPYYDKDTQRWVSVQSERNNLIRKTLTMLGELRHLNEDPQNCISQKNRMQISDFLNKSAFFVHNLFEILKLARSVGTALPDLSGVVFDNLDMTKCDMNHVIFSHHSHEGALCSGFRGTIFDATISFSEGHRATLRNLSVAALYEWDKDYLLSVDETGYAVLTDLRLNLTVCTLSLLNGVSRKGVSNIVRDGNGIMWIACGNELFGLNFEKENGRLSVCRCITLPTATVAQLVVGTDGQLYYHPTTSPLDRFRTDGSPAWEPCGIWFTCATVNRAGNTAYCFYMDDNQGIGGVSRLVRFVRKPEGVWQPVANVISYDTLCNLTNHTAFQNARITFSEDEKTLLLSLYCKKPFNKSKHKNNISSIGKTMAIEIDRDSPSGNLKRYSVMSEGKLVRAICCGTNHRKYFSSYLEICFVNKNCEVRRLRSGTGMLSDVAFMPDTKSFLAITNNPICIQEFCCDPLSDYQCVRQILPSIRSKTVTAFAFRFEPGLKFNLTGFLGYAEHRRQLRLILWHNDEKNVIADLSEGVETEERIEDMTLLRPPLFSIDDPHQDRLSLSIWGESVLMVPYERNRQPLMKINIHPEWLFAGCDFTDAVFRNGEMPPDLKYYIGTNDKKNIPMSENLDIHEMPDEEFSDFEDILEDEYEDTEDDYCDE